MMLYLLYLPVEKSQKNILSVTLSVLVNEVQSIYYKLKYEFKTNFNHSHKVIEAVFIRPINYSPHLEHQYKLELSFLRI